MRASGNEATQKQPEIATHDAPSPGVKPEQSSPLVGVQDSNTGAVKEHMRTDVSSITDSQAVWSEAYLHAAVNVATHRSWSAAKV